MTVPAPLVGETVAGTPYRIFVTDEGQYVMRLVALETGTKGGLNFGWVLLTPDEARALAADLRRWAGHAERAGKR